MQEWEWEIEYILAKADIQSPETVLTFLSEFLHRVGVVVSLNSGPHWPDVFKKRKIIL